MLDSPYERARKRLAERGLRWIAWIWDPAADGSGRLTATHLMPLPEETLGGGERLLCGRLLPDVGDVADLRFEHMGDGVCTPCYTAATKAGLMPPDLLDDESGQAAAG